VLQAWCAPHALLLPLALAGSRGEKGAPASIRAAPSRACTTFQNVSPAARALCGMQRSPLNLAKTMRAEHDARRLACSATNADHSDHTSQADGPHTAEASSLPAVMSGRSRGSLYVKPLGDSVREVDLREKFSPFGELKDVYRPMHHGSGRVRTRSAPPRLACPRARAGATRLHRSVHVLPCAAVQLLLHRVP